MKYTVTILTQAGTYEEVVVEVPVDIEQTWQDFLTHKSVIKALKDYEQCKIVDIDPQINFKTIDGKLYADVDGMCHSADFSSEDV